MRWLDRTIEYLAPSWALSRERARAGMALVRHYEAASVGRRTSGWNRATGDANAVVGSATRTVRAVARDLVRNNAHARRGVKTIANHTVGWGIVPKAMAPRARELWKAWAETTACDADGRNDFYGLQKLVTRTVAESGEVLIRRRMRRPDDGLPLPLQIQVIEADYLDTDRTGVELQNGGRIINGVEFNAIGRRVAYWLFKEHPGAQFFGGGYNSVRVPAEGIAHVYYQERPGQVRGMSWLASIILMLKDYDEYVDAQLLKQKIAAYLAVIMTDPTGQSPAFGRAEDQDSTQPAIDKIKPGAVIYGAPGAEATIVQPPRVAEFSDYASTTLHSIAAGMDMTYEDLTGDYSMVNFSSARMSRLSHWDCVHDWRWQMLIPQMCDPVWRWAMDAAIIMNLLDEMPAAEWTPPPMPMIEPDREGLAYQRNIRAGIMSLSEALRERGYDPREMLREIAADNKMIDQLELVLDSDARKTTQQGMMQMSTEPPPPRDPNAPTAVAAPASGDEDEAEEDDDEDAEEEEAEA